jgi:hypothetical protein
MSDAPKQPRLRRWLRRGLIGCAVLTIAVVAYGWALWHNANKVQLTVSKETTRIVEPLREDGYVDYISALNQRGREGVTPENNGAVLLWRAMGLRYAHVKERGQLFEHLEMEPLPEKGNYFVDFDHYVEESLGDDFEVYSSDTYELLESVRNAPWTSEDFPVFAEWIEANAIPFDLVHQAAERERFFSPIIARDEGTTIFDAGVPVFDMLEDIVEVLCVRAMLAAGEGRYDDALRDLEVCHKLARLVDPGVNSINTLIASRAERSACVAGAALALRGDLPIESLRRFSDVLDRLAPFGPLAEKVDVGERYTFLDTVGRVGRFGPVALIEGGMEPSIDSEIRRTIANSVMDWDDLARQGNDYFDQLVGVVDLPSRVERMDAIHAIIGPFENPPDGHSYYRRFVSNQFRRHRLNEVMLGVFLPFVTAQTSARDKSSARLGLARLAFALAAYRAEHGAFPADLSRLSPEYIGKLPKDVYFDGDFQYETTDDGYRLWSVGPDGFDDGGMGPDLKNYKGDYKGDGDDLLIATPE